MSLLQLLSIIRSCFKGKYNLKPQPHLVIEGGRIIFMLSLLNTTTEDSCFQRKMIPLCIICFCNYKSNQCELV